MSAEDEDSHETAHSRSEDTLINSRAGGSVRVCQIIRHDLRRSEVPTKQDNVAAHTYMTTRALTCNFIMLLPRHVSGGELSNSAQKHGRKVRECSTNSLRRTTSFLGPFRTAAPFACIMAMLVRGGGTSDNWAQYSAFKRATDGPMATPSYTEIPNDDDAGGWRWEMPDRQDDLAVGGDIRRLCMNCASPQVVQGVSAARLKGRWVAFFCKHCAPHLSVRNNAQVPVTWTGPTANVTGALTMLPLYKRCRRCRRWATFGVRGNGSASRKRHCKAHALASEVPVHRRACEAANCSKRPSFASVGEWLPVRCSEHKVSSDMDVCHARCLHRDVTDGLSVRCWRSPTYGFKHGSAAREGNVAGAAAGGAKPQMCWEHKSAAMVKVVFAKCRFKGCTAEPLYARPTERKLFYCPQHRRDGDVCLAQPAPPQSQQRSDTSAVATAVGAGAVASSSPAAASTWSLSNVTLSSTRRHRSRFAIEL